MRELEKTAQQIMSQFETITWFTYRRTLEQSLPSSKLTSDSGWGCMLRTGQMLLFQGLIRHCLGKDFNYREALTDKHKMVQLNKYYRLLGLFMDNIDDSRLSPFGIHSIGRVGLTHGRKPGDWYGPQAICNVL